MEWLSKLKLFEVNEPELPPEPEPEIVPEESVPEVEVDADIQSAANIVDEIYVQNNLSDKTDSIYTVQALINTLPPEMTTMTKQATVAGILAVSGTKVSELMKDAEIRVSILKAAESKIVDERNAEINEANADIEALKQAIESATIKIRKAEEIISATQKSIADETKNITSLMNFCKEMEASK